MIKIHRKDDRRMEQSVREYVTEKVKALISAPSCWRSLLLHPGKSSRRKLAEGCRNRSGS